MLFDLFIATVWLATSYLFHSPMYTLGALLIVLGLGVLSTAPRSRS